MTERILLVGAAGAIGRRLVPLLRATGYRVAGTTRSPAKAAALRDAGVEPLVVDVFDAVALARAVAAIRPDVVVHQLTDLAGGFEPDRIGETLARNARIRTEGTGNLVRAALAAGVPRLVAQSIAWAYAPGPEPHVEADPLDVAAVGNRAITVGGIVALENATLKSPPLQGVVLRYGEIYGPGTDAEDPSGPMPLHVDAAAHAALLAIRKDARGIFNIAEPNHQVATDNARAELGWNPAFRLPD